MELGYGAVMGLRAEVDYVCKLAKAALWLGGPATVMRSTSDSTQPCREQSEMCQILRPASVNVRFGGAEKFFHSLFGFWDESAVSSFKTQLGVRFLTSAAADIYCSCESCLQKMNLNFRHLGFFAAGEHLPQLPN